MMHLLTCNSLPLGPEIFAEALVVLKMLMASVMLWPDRMRRSFEQCQ